jgi:hypothetical protein
MSTRHKNEPEYDNHQRAAELHDLAAQAHRSAADAREKEEHQTGHERSRRALEHSREANEQSGSAPSNARHGIATFGHQDTAVLAHAFWQARGCPEGSADEDWFRAVRDLRRRVASHSE